MLPVVTRPQRALVHLRFRRSSRTRLLRRVRRSRGQESCRVVRSSLPRGELSVFASDPTRQTRALTRDVLPERNNSTSSTISAKNPIPPFLSSSTRRSTKPIQSCQKCRRKTGPIPAAPPSLASSDSRTSRARPPPRRVASKLLPSTVSRPGKFETTTRRSKKRGKTGSRRQTRTRERRSVKLAKTTANLVRPLETLDDTLSRRVMLTCVCLLWRSQRIKPRARGSRPRSSRS